MAGAGGEAGRGKQVGMDLRAVLEVKLQQTGPFGCSRTGAFRRKERETEMELFVTNGVLVTELVNDNA